VGGGGGKIARFIYILENPRVVEIGL